MFSVKDIPSNELQLAAIRAGGPGGQNVNKVSSAIHLRFDIKASSLPERVKQQLLQMADSRISSDGVVVIKAQSMRKQEQNRAEALERLDELLHQAQRVVKKRRATRPTRGSVKRRLDTKRKQANRKKQRGKVDDY